MTTIPMLERNARRYLYLRNQCSFEFSSPPRLGIAWEAVSGNTLEKRLDEETDRWWNSLDEESRAALHAEPDRSGE